MITAPELETAFARNVRAAPPRVADEHRLLVRVHAPLRRID